MGALTHGWAGSCGSYYDCRMHFRKPWGNFEDKDLLPAVSGGYIASGADLGPCLCSSPRVGCQWFCRFSLYWLMWGIKARIRAWEGRSRSHKESVIWVTQGFLKGTFAGGVGWPSSLSGCFSSSCVIPVAICLFVMDVFWNGGLVNQKLNVRHL